MSNYLATDTDLTAVADAIRTKGGTSASLAFPSDFVSAINAISGGGGGGDGEVVGNILTFHCATVEIGANTISSTSALADYLYAAVGLTSSYDKRGFWFTGVEGQTPYYNYIGGRNLTYWTSGSGLQVMRYRNGAYTAVALATNYDAAVQSGTKYIVWWASNT